MGRKTEDQKTETGSHHTEACPKVRRRWKRTMIVEVVAWLYLHHCRIHGELDALTRAKTLMLATPGRKLITQARAEMGLLQRLIDLAPHTWDAHEWQEAVDFARSCADGAGLPQEWRDAANGTEEAA